jgi:predicted Zn finger-like uncharacterized protein
MSFITRCPACGTAFKVVSDQLKISEGWVRCGHCAQVFDATLDLQPWWPGVEAVAASDAAVHSPAAAQVPVGVGDAGEPASTEPADEVYPPEAHAVAEFNQTDVEDSPTSPDPEPAQPAEPQLDARGEAELYDHLEPPAPFTAVDAGLDQNASTGQEPELAVEFDESGATIDRAPKPSFVRQAERRAFWRRPAVQIVGGVAALLLGVALVFQVALHWGESLAVRFPAAAPWIRHACQVTGCYAGPPRAIEQLSIDSSALVRRSAGSYAFDMVVKNATLVEVATPALELTLTDANDRVLVRRVLSPSDWPEPRETLTPGDRAVRLHLMLDGPEAAVMTGYRAVLFYP